MSVRTWPKTSINLGLILLFAFSGGKGVAQEGTDWLGPSGGPNLRVVLRDTAQNARKHIAAVEVVVRNIWLNYPDDFAQPGIQVGVLQYQIDHCPGILTTETRIRFQQLPAGNHTITVELLGMDNRLLAPAAHLQVTVP